MQRTMEKWKRKDFQDTVEIIVSNFKLEGSEKGEWECVRRGERKTFLSRLMFGRERETFPSFTTKIKFIIHYMNELGASFTFYRDGCNQVAYLKTACVLTDYTIYWERQLECKLLQAKKHATTSTTLTA